MSELDHWVQDYHGCDCGRTVYHVYSCVRAEGLDEEKWCVGTRFKLDGMNFEVCSFVDPNGGPVGEDWRMVYAFHVPQPMDESEWNGLYGDTELASNG